MKKVLVLMAGFLLIGVNLYAGNGDLIVNGKVGIGTTIPIARLDLTGYTQSNSLFSVRQSGNNIEFGHQNGAGYGSVIGNNVGNGRPFIAFNAEAGTTWNTFRTRGIAGRIMTSDLSGGLLFSRATNANADNQDITDDVIINWNGNVGIGTTSPDPIYKLTVVGSALASGGIWQNSDIRLKKNILLVDGALDKILKLNGVSYEWKHGKDFEGETSEAFKTDEDGNIKDDKYRDLPEGRTVGVIAQELEKVLPEAVNTGEDGIKAVEYTRIIPVLIEAIKEQQKRIEVLEKKVAQLK